MVRPVPAFGLGPLQHQRERQPEGVGHGLAEGVRGVGSGGADAPCGGTVTTVPEGSTGDQARTRLATAAANSANSAGSIGWTRFQRLIRARAAKERFAAQTPKPARF